MESDPTEVVYDVSTRGVQAIGVRFTREGVSSVAPAVQALLADVGGIAEIQSMMEGLLDTEFTGDQIAEFLALPEAVEEWRVGEALAEEFLVRTAACSFPWPHSRSSRNPRNSEGGVDLIGLRTSEEVQFALGEVKTSHQAKWPPDLLTSRSKGLHSQLSGLLMADHRHKAAIRYLMMNAINKPWRHEAARAFRKYMEDSSSIHVVGVVVHATDPNSKDLENLALALEDEARPVDLCLHAIYVQPGALSELANSEVALETVQ